MTATWKRWDREDALAPAPPRRHGLRIGVLGGSFNPAHVGHRHLSLQALRRLRLHQVWWLVSPQNPLKPTTEMAALADRLRYATMLARHPRLRVQALETRLRTRYTIDTLRALRQRFPQHRFVWLMGADNLRQVRRWKRWRGVFASTPVAVFSRYGYDRGALASLPARALAARRMPESRATALAARQPAAWVFLRGPGCPEAASRLRRNGFAFPPCNKRSSPCPSPS